jgi:hypothetical protein
MWRREPLARRRRTQGERAPSLSPRPRTPSGASAHPEALFVGLSLAGCDCSLSPPNPRVPESAVSSARLHLTFPGHLASEPVLHGLATEFGLVTNIRRANIEERGGWIIVEVEGDEERIVLAVSWLAEHGLQVDRIDE